VEAALQRRPSIQIGLTASIVVHLLIVAWLAFNFRHPQDLAPPVDLSNAIAISMEPFRPKPPEPPKEKPKPQTPKDVVTTTAPEPDVSIATPPDTPSPPAEQEPSAGNPAEATYAAMVAAALQRAKQYPREALQGQIQGVVVAYFVVNHQGHVIGYRIEESSGQFVLDREVVRLLKYVRFPEIPNDGGDPERREFKLPLTFKIEH
jgi:protein TonB